MSEYRALYRKWRPVDFDDVSGQKATTDILKYEVASNKISHAYLFCGSRGTGKTSCAKILAKAVNCLNPRNGNPCNECEACKSIDAGVATDVIEMDAASNNGVGNVRDMKDEIAFTPALLKYRVYIIDEVHMMSGSAFNALLKTLEEPPSYVVFILATTEFNKLPTTIVSRCQRFDFRRMTTEVIVERLKKISDAEGIDLGDDGAAVIARAAEGGMRDAVSLLELCAGSRKRIDAELVFETVGRGNRSSIYDLIEKVLDKNYSAVYSAIADVVTVGSDLTVFWQELLDAYRDIMVVKNTSGSKAYLDLTDIEYERLTKLASAFTMSKLLYHTSVLEQSLADLLRAKESKRSVAEIALTRMCDAKLSSGAEALLERIEELERANVLWEKKWVACGDSFTEGDFTNAWESDYVFEDGLYAGQKKVYPFFIGRRNHMTVINEAKCGSTMTVLSRKDAFSIERYKLIPEDADYITLCFGINDDEKHQSAPIGCIDDTETTTFLGAWNTVLEYLITHHPYAKIGIIVPNACTTPYTDAIRRVARKWGIPALDIAGDYNVPLMNRVGDKTETCEKVIKFRNARFGAGERNGHPSARAHEYESTFIENWLRSL